MWYSREVFLFNDPIYLETEVNLYLETDSNFKQPHQSFQILSPNLLGLSTRDFIISNNDQQLCYLRKTKVCK